MLNMSLLKKKAGWSMRSIHHCIGYEVVICTLTRANNPLQREILMYDAGSKASSQAVHA